MSLTQAHLTDVLARERRTTKKVPVILLFTTILLKDMRKFTFKAKILMFVDL
jgi:hypothetical protein